VKILIVKRKNIIKDVILVELNITVFIILKKEYVKNAVVLQYVFIIKLKTNVKNAQIHYVFIKNLNTNVENVMVIVIVVIIA